VCDGMLRPPQRPGIGWQIDEEQVNRYRKAD
jgi:L-alanine-DL-glutamate epimerase-like enolase superfamily enzyme